MIEYTTDRWGILFAFSLKGSVFPKSFIFAMICASLTVCLHVLVRHIGFIDDVEVSSKGTSVLSMFTFVLGFLLVFRTQQAYSRWWEGGTLLQELRGEWFNAYSCLLAFANPAKDRKNEVDKFQHQLARLMSMLYGAGLAQVCSLNQKSFEVIDLEDFDIDSLAFIDDSHDACEIALQWIQRLIVDADAKKIIQVAPPILSRVYNQLGNGMVKLNNARKITKFPIPYPFAQMVTVMLMLHWVMIAVICSTSIENIVWSALLSFVVTISFWSINFIGLELEDPFGDDPNDLPIHDMQCDLNKSLKELLKPTAMKAPEYNFNYAYHCQLTPRIIDFNSRMHDSVIEYKNSRQKNCFETAEADLVRRGGVLPSESGSPALKAAVAPAPQQIPPPAAAPAPTPAPAAVVAPAPAVAAVAVVPADNGKGEVTAKHMPSGIDEEYLEVNHRMEQHLSRAVSELEQIADKQTVLYQLHCDFWGLLSVIFQRTAANGAHGAQLRPATQLFQPPCPPEVARHIPGDIRCDIPDSFHEMTRDTFLA